MPDYIDNAPETWYTTGVSVGAGDGTSYANRKAFPADVDNYTLISPNVDGTVWPVVYVVREVSDGGLIFSVGNPGLGNFTAYGDIITVTDAAKNDDPSITWKVNFGGTVAVKGNILRFAGNTRLTHSNVGNDGTDPTIDSQLHFPTLQTYGAEVPVHLINSVIGMKLSQAVFLYNAVLRDSHILNGGTYWLGSTTASLEIINCTADSRWIGKWMNQFTGSFYDNNLPALSSVWCSYNAVLQRMRKIDYTVKDGGGNPLSGIEILVSDGSGRETKKFITDTSGLPQPVGMAYKGEAYSGSIFLIYDLRTYAYPKDPPLKEYTDGDLIIVTDAGNLARFVFVDPTGTYETIEKTLDLTGDTTADVIMAVASSIIITNVGVPNNRTPNHTFNITCDFSSVPTEAVVYVSQGGIEKFAFPMTIDGLSGSARVAGGILSIGTYDVIVVASTVSGFGRATA